MRYLVILFFVVVLLASGCKKPAEDNSFQYTIDSIKDIKVTNKDSSYFTLHARLLSGDPANEPVTLKISGLPQGVTVTPDSVTFKLNYDLPFMFKASDAVPGTYKIQLTEYNTSLGTRRHEINIEVVKEPDCADKVVGHYFRSNGYISGDSSYLNVVTLPSLPHRFAMKGFFVFTSDTVYADINCDDETFIIPLQHFHDTTVWGNGAYLAGTKQVYFEQHTVITGQDTMNGNSEYDLR